MQVTIIVPVEVEAHTDSEPMEQIGKYSVVDLTDGNNADILKKASEAAANDESVMAVMDLSMELGNRIMKNHPEIEVHFTPFAGIVKEIKL